MDTAREIHTESGLEAATRDILISQRRFPLTPCRHRFQRLFMSYAIWPTPPLPAPPSAPRPPARPAPDLRYIFGRDRAPRGAGARRRSRAVRALEVSQMVTGSPTFGAPRGTPSSPGDGRRRPRGRGRRTTLPPRRDRARRPRRPAFHRAPPSKSGVPPHTLGVFWSVLSPGARYAGAWVMVIFFEPLRPPSIDSRVQTRNHARAARRRNR